MLQNLECLLLQYFTISSFLLLLNGRSSDCSPLGKEYIKGHLLSLYDTFPDIAACVLRDTNCTLPLAITAKVNDRGLVTLLVSDPTTLAAAFLQYFDALTTQLNRSFQVGDSPGLPFHLAPNEVPLVIHSLPFAFLPKYAEELFPSLVVSILNSKEVQILSARFLNPNPESRAGKSATSVIVSVNPGAVPRMGSSIRLNSRWRTFERVYSSN